MRQVCPTSLMVLTLFSIFFFGPLFSCVCPPPEDKVIWYKSYNGKLKMSIYCKSDRVLRYNLNGLNCEEAVSTSRTTSNKSILATGNNSAAYLNCCEICVYFYVLGLLNFFINRLRWHVWLLCFPFLHMVQNMRLTMSMSISNTTHTFFVIGWEYITSFKLANWFVIVLLVSCLLCFLIFFFLLFFLISFSQWRCALLILIFIFPQEMYFNFFPLFYSFVSTCTILITFMFSQHSFLL